MARQRFARDDNQSDQIQDGPPNPVGIIARQLLFPWMKANGPLPQPCPYRADDCAAWWLNEMQEPERRGETTQAPKTGTQDGGMRWDCGYAVSRMDALRAFLNLENDSKRRAIVACVTDEKVPYRGDSFAQYTEIFEETLKMREDPDKYKREAVSRAKHAVANFGKTDAFK